MAKQKLDGRRVVPGSVFPYRLTNAQKARLITWFEDSGKSFHSSRGSTVGVIIEHCLLNDIKFTLCRGIGGCFSIEKITMDDFEDERICSSCGRTAFVRVGAPPCPDCDLGTFH